MKLYKYGVSRFWTFIWYLIFGFTISFIIYSPLFFFTEQVRSFVIANNCALVVSFSWVIFSLACFIGLICLLDYLHGIKTQWLNPFKKKPKGQ